MIFKPFRPPLLKKPAATDASPPGPASIDAERPAKRRRMSSGDGGDDETSVAFTSGEDDDEDDDALNSFLDEAEGLPVAPRPTPSIAAARPPRPKLSSSAFRKAHESAKETVDVPSKATGSPGGVEKQHQHASLLTASGERQRKSEAAPSDANSQGEAHEAYFNALWRKVTAKKNKTWDGDGILIVSNGIARLQDLQGRDMGRAKCVSTVAVGTILSLHGKEVEVDSHLSKAEFLSGRSHLNAGANKPTIKELEQQMRTGVRFNATPSASIQQLGATPKPALVQNSASQRKPLNAAFKNPLLNNTSHAMPVARGGDLTKPVPRHDPKKDGALVMKRLSKAPAGKQTVDIVVDPLVSINLRNHQRDGVKFMYECVMGMRSIGEGCILADEMGLGKTLQVIALIWTLLKQNPVFGDAPVVKKALIVCPATLIKNWRKEFRKWLGNERIGVFVVEDKARIRDFTHGKAYSVCIIGYEKLVKEQEQFQHGPGIDLVIADEGHRLKTATNKAAQAIKSLSTERRIVLSGTPLQNNLGEFYFTTDLVNPGILGKPGVFKKQFETPIVRGRQQDASPADIEMGEARYKELAELTGQFLLRRTADILAHYLPPKTEYVLFCKPTAAQAQVYRSILSSPSFTAVLKAAETSLQLINVLKKVCNSPNLLKQREESEEKDSTIRSVLSNIPSKLISTPGASGKLQVLDMLLHTIQTTTTEKVVLVSHYTATLDILATLLAGLDFSFLRLDGSTPQSKRQALVDKFNRTSASDCFAFLLSAKSGGAGLNLIGASRLILFDVDWNPSTDAQAMARIHRDGQTRPCHIYRLMTRGALDEKIYQRQITKQGLADSVVDSKKDSGSAFSREELQQLFYLDEKDHCQTHELLGCACGGRGQISGSSLTAALSVAEDTARSRSTSRSGSEDKSEDESSEGTSSGQIDDTSAKPELPSFVKSSELEHDLHKPGEQNHAVTSVKRKRSRSFKHEGAQFASLLQFRHIDTSLFSAKAEPETSSKLQEAANKAKAAIDDSVLLKVLRHTENRITYVFAKTAGGSKQDNDVGDDVAGAAEEVQQASLIA